MKPKKPTRIKGEVCRAFKRPTLREGWCDHLLLPIDNPDALVEQVRADVLNALKSPWPVGACLEEVATNAALRSIGVPLKKSATKTAAPPSQQGRLRLR